MPIYEKKWWKKLFQKDKRTKHVDCGKDIRAIIEFMNELENDRQKLLSEFTKLKELDKEYHIAKSGLIHVNVDTQARVFDNILQQYEFFQNDVEINGLRIKRLSKEILKRAKKAGMQDLIEEKKKDIRWHLHW